MSTVAFPAISSGIFGFPLKQCSEILLTGAIDFLRLEEFPRSVIFCPFHDKALTVFAETLDSLSSAQALKG
jgi:O-acetyl-ADP-ribose deacetylase (regulator of RNase III)